MSNIARLRTALADLIDQHAATIHFGTGAVAGECLAARRVLIETGAANEPGVLPATEVIHLPILGCIS